MRIVPFDARPFIPTMFLMRRALIVIPALAATLATGAHAQGVGSIFCNPTFNSTAAKATLVGTTGSAVGANLHLEVDRGVPGEIGYFLAGNEVTTGVAISGGMLCLIGTGTARVYRYNVAGTISNSIGQFDGSGVLQNIAGTSATGTGFDVPDTIPGTVPLSILSGDTWHFQLWYRDTLAAQGSSNFSNGLSVTFPVLPGPTPISGMVPIPAGSFFMGSDTSSGPPFWANDNEHPAHYVTISRSFWMGETEVTQAQYEGLMGYNPSQNVGPNHPVEMVSALDAEAYCDALTAQEQALGNVPAGFEYRLPTEAEWEYACRAGTATEFNVGQSLYCNQALMERSEHSSSHCQVSSTLPVASFPPNAFGLYDMHGSVWEWCFDTYEDYSTGSVVDPYSTGTYGFEDRNLRGGGWRDSSDACRSACRGYLYPGSRHKSFGFRIVLARVLP